MLWLQGDVTSPISQGGRAGTAIDVDRMPHASCNHPAGLQDDSGAKSDPVGLHAGAGSSPGTIRVVRTVELKLSTTSIRPDPAAAAAGEGVAVATHISSTAALHYGAAVDAWWRGLWCPAMVVSTTHQGAWVMLTGREGLPGPTRAQPMTNAVSLCRVHDKWTLSTACREHLSVCCNCVAAAPATALPAGNLEFLQDQPLHRLRHSMAWSSGVAACAGPCAPAAAASDAAAATKSHAGQWSTAEVQTRCSRLACLGWGSCCVEEPLLTCTKQEKRQHHAACARDTYAACFCGCL